MNYDMITEMYEATRYAKEMHKKAEKEKNKAQAYKDILNNSDSRTIRRNLASKVEDTEGNYRYYNSKDSIKIGKGGMKIADKQYDGRKVAAFQPGRYEKHEERKPNTYLNAQRKMRGE